MSETYIDYVPLYRGGTREEFERAGRALPKKEYVCICGEVLTHDAYYKHRVQCENKGTR